MAQDARIGIDSANWSRRCGNAIIRRRLFPEHANSNCISASFAIPFTHRNIISEIMIA